MLLVFNSVRRRRGQVAHLIVVHGRPNRKHILQRRPGSLRLGEVAETVSNHAMGDSLRKKLDVRGCQPCAACLSAPCGVVGNARDSVNAQGTHLKAGQSVPLLSRPR